MSDEVLIQKEMDPNRPVMIFVLGIISIMACQICGPVAFFLGQQYRRECVVRGIEPDGLATAGWVMGIIGTVLLTLGLVFALIYIGFFCVFFGAYFIALFGMLLTI